MDQTNTDPTTSHDNPHLTTNQTRSYWFSNLSLALNMAEFIYFAMVDRHLFHSAVQMLITNLVRSIHNAVWG